MGTGNSPYFSWIGCTIMNDPLPAPDAKVLFILTHRLGDVLQAFPAFALARRGLSDARLHLLTDDSCVALAGLCPDLDRVHAFPRARLLPASGRGAFAQAEEVLDLAERLRAEKFTHVVNLMGNPSAALLGSLAGGDSASGGGRRFSAGGSRSVGQRWARILFALPAARAWQPFHLSEIFARLTAESLGLRAELLPPGLVVERLRGLEVIRRAAGNGDAWMALRRPWVGIQGGASKGLRRPPGAWLRTFGREFLGQLGGSLFLLGTAAEAEAFQPLLQCLVPAQRRRCVDLCGTLDLPALAGVVANLGAVASVDTFTLHLAAAVGTPVLGLYPGPANPQETGPWGGGHRVLWADRRGRPCGCEDQCQAPRDGLSECWERLHPELAVGALDLLLSRGDAAALGGRRVRALETELGPGGYSLKSLDGPRDSDPEAGALAALARAWALGGERPAVALPRVVREGFSALGRSLIPGAHAADLTLRGDPPDWFRAQLLSARDEHGATPLGALEDVARGCAFFASLGPVGAGARA